jgi:hypothetical protein
LYDQPLVPTRIFIDPREVWHSKPEGLARSAGWGRGG